MATLCLLNDEGAVLHQWEIGDRPVIVGRGGCVDVQIEDEGLSRRHFLIACEGEEFLLKDLSSRNGTWVDGERALAVNLRHDCRILAGRTQFRFSEDHLIPTTPIARATGPHDTVVIPVSLRS